MGGGELYEKPAAWVNIAAANRGQGAQATLATVLGYVGAVVIESACRHIPVDRSAVGADGMIADLGFRTGMAEVWVDLIRDTGQVDPARPR